SRPRGDSGQVSQLPLVVAIGVHDPDVPLICRRAAREHDPAVGRPGWHLVFEVVERKLSLVRPIGTHSEDLSVSIVSTRLVASAEKDDGRPIARVARRMVAALAERLLAGPIWVHDADPHRGDAPIIECDLTVMTGVG